MHASKPKPTDHLLTKQVAHNAVNAGQSTAVNIRFPAFIALIIYSTSAINAGKSMFRQATATAASTRYNHYPAPTPTTAAEIQIDIIYI